MIQDSNKALDKHDCKDAGMAFTLIFLLIYMAVKASWPIPLAIVCLVVTMTAPTVLYYPAKLWFWLSKSLGFVVSNILLTVLFYVLVTPIALARRMLGHDAMKLKEWKKGKSSVFVTRNCTYSRIDLERPF